MRHPSPRVQQTFGKAAMLLRDHSAGQIWNAAFCARYTWMGTPEDDPDAQQFIRGLESLQFRIPVELPALYQRNYNPRGCTMPFRFLTAGPDSSIGPCCVEGTAPHFGNCLSEKGIWNGQTMMAVRRKLIDASAPLPSLCQHCEEIIRVRRKIGGRRSSGLPEME